VTPTTNPNCGDHDLLIQLDTKVDSIKECLTGLDGLLKDYDNRMRAIEEKEARHSETIKAIQSDVGTLKSESRAWNGINSLAATLVAIFTYLRSF
jgi:hypothetical protein